MWGVVARKAGRGNMRCAHAVEADERQWSTHSVHSARGRGCVLQELPRSGSRSRGFESGDTQAQSHARHASMRLPCHQPGCWSGAATALQPRRVMLAAHACMAPLSAAHSLSGVPGEGSRGIVREWGRCREERVRAAACAGAPLHRPPPSLDAARVLA